MQNLDATTKRSQLASIPAITIDSAAAGSSAAVVHAFEPEQVDDPASSSSTRAISNANPGDQNEEQLKEDYNLTQNILISSPRHQQQQTQQLITTIMNAQAIVAAAVEATPTGMTTASSSTALTSATSAAVSFTATVSSPSAGATLLWNAAIASQLREILLQHNVQLSTCSSIIASCLQNTSLVEQVIPTSVAERPPEITAASTAATSTPPVDCEQPLLTNPSETAPQKPHATALSTLTDVAVKLLVTSRTKTKPPLLRGTSSTFSNASIVDAKARLPAQQDAAASAVSTAIAEIQPYKLLPTLSSSIIYKPKSRFLAASIADDNAKQQQQQQQNLPATIFGLKPVSSAAILADVIRHSISPSAAAAVASSSSATTASPYTWKAISAVGSGGVVCDLTTSGVSSPSSIGLMTTSSAAAAAAAILSGRLACNTSPATGPVTHAPFVVPLPTFTSQTPLTTSVTTLTLPTYSTSIRSHRAVFMPHSVEERKRVSSFEGIRASSYRVQEHQRPPAPDRRLPLLVNRSNSSFCSMPPCISSANVVIGVNDSRRTRSDQHNEFLRYQQQQRAPLLPAPVSAKLDISTRVLPVLAKILQQAGIEVDTTTEPQRQRQYRQADEGEAGKERAQDDEDVDEDDGDADDYDDDEDDDSDDVHILENVDDIPVTTHIVTGRRTATVYTQQRAPVVLQRLHSSRQQQQSYSLPNNTVKITTTTLGGGNERKQRAGDAAALRSSTNSPSLLSASNLSPLPGTSTAVTVVHHMAGCSQSIDVTTTTSRTATPSVKTPLSAPPPSTGNLQARRMLRKRASSSSLSHERHDEEQQQRKSEQQSSQRQRQQQQQRATLTISPATTTASSSAGSSSSAGAYLYASISGGAASSSTKVIGSSSKKSKSTSGVRGRPRHSESKSAKYARHHRDKMRNYRVKVHDERDRLRTVVMEQEEEIAKLEDEKASLREQIHCSYLQAPDTLKPKLDLMLF